MTLDLARFGNDFLAMTPQEQKIKEKLGKMDLKFKTSASKDTNKKVK